MLFALFYPMIGLFFLLLHMLIPIFLLVMLLLAIRWLFRHWK